MSYLIDTNVISEPIKLKQSPEVIQWFNLVQDQDLYLSVLTIGEIRKGIGKVTDMQKKEKLSIWLDQELTTWFKNRILLINEQVANKWGIV